MISKKKSGLAVLAAAAVLGVSGVAIGCGSSDSGSTGQTDQTAETTQETSGESTESQTSGKLELKDGISETDGRKAADVAEQATGGTATEVGREGGSLESVKDATGNKLTASTNIAFEVEIDRDGEELDVYLNEKFEVIAVKISSASKEENVTGSDADRASAAAEKATGGKMTEVERRDPDSLKAAGSTDSSLIVAWQVEVDIDGHEADVYLNGKFDVVAVKLD